MKSNRYKIKREYGWNKRGKPVGEGFWNIMWSSIYRVKLFACWNIILSLASYPQWSKITCSQLYCGPPYRKITFSNSHVVMWHGLLCTMQLEQNDVSILTRSNLKQSMLHSGLFSSVIWNVLGTSYSDSFYSRTKRCGMDLQLTWDVHLGSIKNNLVVKTTEVGGSPFTVALSMLQNMKT